HYDYRGSTVALTDGTGNVTDRFEYSAYGTLTYRTGSTDTPFLFNGRYGVQTDPNGLLYMRARYYNPYICRFINPDPIGFSGGLNWYAYAEGDPVQFSDPSGLWFGIDDAIFAGVGGLIGMGGRLVGDLITGNRSTWEDYVGAFVGGAAGGETLLYTANPFLAGAAGGAAAKLTSQGLKLATGKQTSFNATSLAVDTGLGAATGFIPGRPKIAGVNAGRGSDLQIFRQIVTKAENGTINNISTETAWKMAAGAFYEYGVAPGAGASSIGSTLASEIPAWVFPSQALQPVYFNPVK
ncbi:MAG: RHS repeat-associated core domain-containing protein, partial [Limisphaera sp.]|nr:RHS repeat-associated core domain-containing protein [Limisphaera sp.]